MRKLLSVIFALMLPALAYGQTSKSITTNATCTSTSASCLIVDTLGQGTVGIQITGSFSGTLQFEQTIDGSTWTTWPVLPNGSTTAVTSATAAGLWSGGTTAKQVRVRASAFSSGTAVVSAVGTQSRRSSGGSGGSTFTNSAELRALLSDPTGTAGNAVFSGSPTIVTPTIASFANATHNHQAASGGGTLAEAALALTDVTTKDASSSAHGFLPKTSGNAYDFFLGNGTYGMTVARGSIAASSPWTFSQTWTGTSGATMAGLKLNFANVDGSIGSRAFQVNGGSGGTTEQAYITIGGLFGSQSASIATTLFAPTHQVGVGGSLDFSDGSNYNFTIDRSTGGRFRLGTVTTSQPFKFSQTWNAGGVTFDAFTIDVTETAAAADATMFKVSKDSTCYFAVTKQSGGTSCTLSVRTNGETHVGDFHVDAGQLTIPAGHYVQDASSRWWIHGAGADLFSIGSSNAAKEYTIVTGAVPTCSSGCGTSPTLSATNSVGRITLGSAPSATTVVLNFSVTNPTAPHCDATNETQISIVVATASTTQLTLTGVFTASDAISWHCVSWQAP